MWIATEKETAKARDREERHEGENKRYLSSQILRAIALSWSLSIVRNHHALDEP
jgi:hypothetical protein